MLRTPNSVLSGAGAGTAGVSMKLVNSSEYSDLYTSLLAIVAKTDRLTRPYNGVQCLLFE